MLPCDLHVSHSLSVKMTGKKAVEEICIKGVGKLLTIPADQFNQLCHAHQEICCADATDSTWEFTHECWLPLHVKRTRPGSVTLSKKPWNTMTMSLSEFATLLTKTKQGVDSVNTALRRRRTRRKKRKARYAENFVTYIPSGDQYTKADYILWAAAPSVVHNIYCRSVWSISFCLDKCANVCPSREDHMKRLCELPLEEIKKYARKEDIEYHLRNTWRTLVKLKPYFSGLISRSQVRTIVTENWDILKEHALENFKFANDLQREEEEEEEEGDFPQLLKIVQNHTKALSFVCKCSLE